MAVFAGEEGKREQQIRKRLNANTLSRVILSYKQNGTEVDLGIYVIPRVFSYTQKKGDQLEQTEEHFFGRIGQSARWGGKKFLRKREESIPRGNLDSELRMVLSVSHNLGQSNRLCGSGRHIQPTRKQTEDSPERSLVHWTLKEREKLSIHEGGHRWLTLRITLHSKHYKNG